MVGSAIKSFYSLETKNMTPLKFQDFHVATEYITKHIVRQGKYREDFVITETIDNIDCNITLAPKSDTKLQVSYAQEMFL
jgi:hypothetical protein